MSMMKTAFIFTVQKKDIRSISYKRIQKYLSASLIKM